MGIATAARLAGPAALALVVVLSGTQDAAAASRPSAPRSVAAKPGNATVRVSWLAPSSTGGAAIDHYAVQRATSSTGTWTTLVRTGATARAWTNTGLTNGHRYYYRVRAHNVVGWSAASATVSAVPRTVPSAPQSPAANPKDSAVQVTWSRPASNGGAAINAYAVQRLDGTWSTFVQVSGSTFASTVTGLVNGTSYSFRVRAHNVAGWSPASATVSAVPRTVPSAPRSPAVTTGDGSATVSWMAPSSSGGSAVDEYQVQYSTDDATWSSASATAAQTQLTVNGLQNGATFHFRVRAHNAAGWGPASSEVLAVPGVPLPPTQVQAQPAASGADLSWTLSATVSPAVTGYEVEWSTDPTVLWDVVQVSSSTTHYALSTTAYGTTYYFRVRAQNAVAYSAWSAVTSAVAGLPPCAVSGLTAQYFGTPFNFIGVDWTASPGDACGSRPLGYRIERIVNEGGYTQIADVDASQTNYTDHDVARFNTYTYRITPHNELGDGTSKTVQVVIN